MTAASAAAGAASAAAMAANVAAAQVGVAARKQGSGAPLGPRTDPPALSDQAAEDAEEVVIAWLTPLRRTGADRKSGDVLPFTLVTHVAGTENLDEGTAAPIVSVHTLVSKALGRNNAKNECKTTHDRMIRLGLHCDFITLADSRVVGVDYVDVVETPIWMPFGDELILRKVGRYEIGLTYVPTG